MGNAFGSIDDLMNKNEKSDEKTSAPVKDETAGVKLSKKMEQIKKQEFEVEAQRTAQSLGGQFPYINLDKFPISQEALKVITREDAEKLKIVCFFITNDQFRIGAVYPDDEAVAAYLKEMEQRLYSTGALYLISQESFDHVFKLYNTLPIVKPISKDIEISAEELNAVSADITNFEAVQKALETKSTTDMLTVILGAGLKLGASDIHVEAEEKDVVVRLRNDGVLYDAAHLDRSVLKQIISRIKLVASLKINITDKPQDGRFTIKLEDGETDVRVSVIPTVYGESVVMRLLRQSRENLTLDDLGFSAAGLAVLKEEIVRPNGMIMTTGPTGSGKTTTLYAILQMLNKPGVKILTLEDPVEYRIEGVNQSQIDHSKKYTFADGLRSILRQDPDIVMVGEIRDLETADIATQAALTGHLMLSTVHTNSAAGAIPRMLAMGVKPFLLTPALNAIIGQRLVRKLVDANKVAKNLEDYDATTQQKVKENIDKMPEQLKTEVMSKPLQFFVPKPGTEETTDGYKGRVGIYEIFRMTDSIKELMSSGNVSEFAVEQAAIADGMITMVQDGILKALEGKTSLEEVFRVTD